MTVRELMAVLARVPADQQGLPVLAEGGADHSLLVFGRAAIAPVEQGRGQMFHEYFDEANLSPGGKRALAFVLA